MKTTNKRQSKLYKSQNFTIYLRILMLLVFLDFVTTGLFLSIGLEESNPLFVYLFNLFGFFNVALFGIPITYILIRTLRNIYYKSNVKWFITTIDIGVYFAIFLRIFVVINNIFGYNAYA